MSFNAILTISEAEENAKKIKAEADAQAKERLAAAEKAGLAAVDAAVEKAAAELKELQSKADDKARAEAESLSATTENKKASLRARAEDRIDKAAELVVERIVNS
jgi:V/A-type H+-transporting ATPase subunit G/H